MGFKSRQKNTQVEVPDLTVVEYAKALLAKHGSPAEVAKILGVGRATVYRWMSDGRLTEEKRVEKLEGDTWPNSKPQKMAAGSEWAKLFKRLHKRKATKLELRWLALVDTYLKSNNAPTEVKSWSHRWLGPHGFDDKSRKRTLFRG